MVACFLRSQTVTAPAVVQVATMWAILGFHARFEMSALGPCWCPSWSSAVHTCQGEPVRHITPHEAGLHADAQDVRTHAAFRDLS